MRTAHATPDEKKCIAESKKTYGFGFGAKLFPLAGDPDLVQHAGFGVDPISVAPQNMKLGQCHALVIIKMAQKSLIH